MVMESKKKSSSDVAGSAPKSLSKIQERSAALKAELNHRRGGAKSRLATDGDDYGGTDSEGKLRGQVKTLKDDLDRRQASYLRRERDYRTRVKLLEEELEKFKSHRTQALDAREQMEQVRDMHETILGNIEHVQEQTARILAEQERDLLRAFRARLFDVQTELEKEKTKAQEGSSVCVCCSVVRCPASVADRVVRELTCVCVCVCVFPCTAMDRAQPAAGEGVGLGQRDGGPP